MISKINQENESVSNYSIVNIDFSKTVVGSSILESSDNIRGMESSIFSKLNGCDPVLCRNQWLRCAKYE